LYSRLISYASFGPHSVLKCSAFKMPPWPIIESAFHTEITKESCIVRPD
jgi:hypothetical protein